MMSDSDKVRLSIIDSYDITRKVSTCALSE
jgi:hypothetical protein